MKSIVHVQAATTKRTILMRVLAGALAALAALAALPQKADAGVFIGVGVSVGVPPPPLPIYEQPLIPGPGYIWTPGYWAWDGDEYYWVPGTWVPAPFYGALWTPCYWGWDNGFYVFHPGYWGNRVGFYGGINYGWGYTGVGYAGGYWGHRGFYYNRAVNHIDNVRITNVYNRTVINNNVTRVSYNGGRGGVAMHATPQQMAFAHHARMGPIPAQQRQMDLARHDPALRLSTNHGLPPIAATQRPGAFNAANAIPARGERFTPAAANVRRMDNNVVQAPHAMPVNNGMALHSASFAPRANASDAANMRPMNTTMPHAPQTMRPNNSADMRSAHFAPHANTPVASNMAPSASRYSNPYHPGSVTGVAPANRPMQPMNAHPVNAYRAPSTAYRPAPAYHPAPAPMYRPQPQYHAPAPQYHANRPAPAPHPTGGGHNPHRD
jgi:hypothetical protein